MYKHVLVVLLLLSITLAIFAVKTEQIDFIAPEVIHLLEEFNNETPEGKLINQIYFDVMVGYYGICTIYGNWLVDYRTITLNHKLMDKPDELKYVLYHELGHCKYNLEHSDYPELMQEYPSFDVEDITSFFHWINLIY